MIFNGHYFVYIQITGTNDCLFLFADMFDIRNFVWLITFVNYTEYPKFHREFPLSEDMLGVLRRNFTSTIAALLIAEQTNMVTFAKVGLCLRVRLSHILCSST